MDRRRGEGGIDEMLLWHFGAARCGCSLGCDGTCIERPYSGCICSVSWWLGYCILTALRYDDDDEKAV